MVEKAQDCKCCGQRHANVDETRRAILEAALEEFALLSVAGARTREIAKKANVNHAAINYHFGGKEEMYRYIIEKSVEHFEQEFMPLTKEVDEFLKKDGKDHKKAIDLIKKILIFHHSFFYHPNFSKFFLLFKREELFPSFGFETIFKKTFKPFHQNFLKLVDIGSQFRHSKKENIMFAIALMNLNGALSAYKVPYLKMISQEELTAADIELFCRITEESVDRLFNESKTTLISDKTNKR